jgi:hypothetical protein
VSRCESTPILGVGQAVGPPGVRLVSRPAEGAGVAGGWRAGAAGWALNGGCSNSGYAQPEIACRWVVRVLQGVGLAPIACRDAMARRMGGGWSYSHDTHYAAALRPGRAFWSQTPDRYSRRVPRDAMWWIGNRHVQIGLQSESCALLG